MKKTLILILLLAVVIPFFVFGFNDLLTLQGIQARLDEFYAWRDAAPLLAGGLFFLAYVLVTSFSLPGAAIMTLLAGALFGLWWGVLLASFASSIGALFAFLASRFVLRCIVRLIHSLGAIELASQIHTTALSDTLLPEGCGQHPQNGALHEQKTPSQPLT